MVILFTRIELALYDAYAKIQKDFCQRPPYLNAIGKLVSALRSICYYCNFWLVTPGNPT